MRIVQGIFCCLQSEEKVAAWLTTENLNFGGCAPVDLIHMGRAHKVTAFVDEAADGNMRFPDGTSKTKGSTNTPT
jgi:hypothetical protein